MKQYFSYILSVLIIFSIVGCSTSQKEIENSQVQKKPLIKKEKYDYIEHDPTIPTTSTTSQYSYDANNANDPINRELEYKKQENSVQNWNYRGNDCSRLSSEAEKSACYNRRYN